MSSIRLSICIPTYNFGNFIGETLESIIRQATDEVEIVVVDGASTDNTEEIVRDYQKRFPRLRYHLIDKKGGIDKDLAKAVELAQGDYCWLLSSDDVLKSGAIDRILHEMAAGYDIYLCNRTECDKNMHPIHNRSWLSRKTGDAVFSLSVKSDLLHYLSKAISIGALFSYMSSIIVLQNKWSKTGYDERFTATNYAHAFRLLTILINGGKLGYIKDPLVLCRGDNDSFLQKGTAHRFLIDLDGYQFLGSRLFHDKDTLRSFHAVIRREFKWYVFAGMSNAVDNAEWSAIEPKLLSFGYSRTALRIARIIGSSRFLVSSARRLREALRRLRFNNS
ncbi:MAG: glycosyltransferase [Nitrospirae bacterium]|nr:glycosyltransferase [Nitrospirota bacterium]